MKYARTALAERRDFETGKMLIESTASSMPPPRVADVLLVGGGTCGLVLADTLRNYGLSVTVVESGAAAPNPSADELNAAEQAGQHYRGATEGRCRCLGGTSLLWGGALLPFLPHDIAPRTHLSLPGWPLAYAELSAHIPTLERIFRLAPGGYDAGFIDRRHAEADQIVDDEVFNARFAKWPSFARRNTAQLFRHRLRQDVDLHVFLNATMQKLRAAPGLPSRLTGIDMLGPDGRVVALHARHIVLCAGAIESTRLLLVAARGSLSRPLAGHAWLGNGFHDHISMHVAEIQPIDRKSLNRMAGFRFQGSTMRSFRLELGAAAQARHRMASAWAHVGFEGTAPSGFDALRAILKNVQRGRSPALADLLSMSRDIGYLSELCAWRLFRRQLLWPAESRYLMTVVSEQLPRRNNCIELSSRLDRLGQPLPRIVWNIDASDLETVRKTAGLLRARWRQRGEATIGPLRWLVNPDRPIEPTGADCSDIFHPGGTTRMGTDMSDSVVDDKLRVFGTDNLYVLSTSVFPSGASANPTMTLLLLGLRLAQQLRDTCATPANVVLSK